MTITVTPQPEVEIVPGQRLGRHIIHDDRSRAFASPEHAKLPDRAMHNRRVPIFDQGQIGSCTGNALAGALCTDPLYITGRDLTETDALTLYERATHVDRVPGVYPPTDTGSSGLGVCKAAKQLGLISAYHHAFSWAAVLSALAAGPVIAGFGWYDSFDRPAAHGLITISPHAQVRGGHETCWIGYDSTTGLIRGTNSWGAGWGDHGYYTLPYTDAQRLLAERGDVTVPQPTP